MNGRGIGEQSDSANLVVRNPPGISASVSVDDLLTILRREDLARRGEKFQPIVWKRVMAGGNLNACDGALIPDEDAGGGGRRHVGIEDVSPDRAQSGADGIGKHSPGRSAIARNDEGPTWKARGKCAGKPGHQFRGKAFADNASQPRDTDDWFLHRSAPTRQDWRCKTRQRMENNIERDRTFDSWTAKLRTSD
jgi:hypothetical protein